MKTKPPPEETLNRRQFLVQAAAVGGALAHNPLPILIPCHRVVRKSGDFGGYRWGLDRKHALLEKEKSAKSARAARTSSEKRCPAQSAHGIQVEGR